MRDDRDEQIGELMAQVARLQAQLDEHLPRIRERGHDISGSLQPINVRVKRIEDAVLPIADKLISSAEYAERLRALEDARMEDAGAKRTANRILAVLSSAIVLALGGVVWLVSTTRDNQEEGRRNARDVAALVVRADRTDAAVQSIQTSAATMTAEIRADRTRQDDRFEVIKASLSRLENRRR